MYICGWMDGCLGLGNDFIKGVLASNIWYEGHIISFMEKMYVHVGNVRGKGMYYIFWGSLLFS
jgi:hypothetical protein